VSRSIRWGIIGCGDVTEVKSGPALQRAKGSELAAVMRRNGALAKDYAQRHGVPRWHDDADQLINDPGVDAVYIATPPGSHFEYALQVARAGKPCYVEKPMARSYAECRRMIDAFEQAKLPLFVAYYRRALPRFVKLKELIDSGKIGRVTGCRYRRSCIDRPIPPGFWRMDVAQSGGGLFLDVGSHVLDLLDHLLGEFVEYGGVAHAMPGAIAEDNVTVHFRSSQGIVGDANWNFAADRNEELLEIIGTSGRISTEILGHSPLTIEVNGTKEVLSIADPPHIQEPLIQTVVDELLGIGKCPSTGISAARTSKVMDAALSSFYGGRDDEFWNRPETWRKT
jgi:1,5-anhydro-D-fructose reductase (1,5-anhydro-D-mannitol-forming)